MSTTLKFPMFVRTLALVAAVPAAAFAQNGAPPEMAAQMAKLGGMMHATAKACGDYSEQELAAMKQQQKATHLERGLDAAAFERMFAEAETEVAQRWQSMSASQRTQTCSEIKQQLSAASQ